MLKIEKVWDIQVGTAGTIQCLPKNTEEKCSAEKKLQGILSERCTDKKPQKSLREKCVQNIPVKISVSRCKGHMKEKSSLTIFEKYGNMKYMYKNRRFCAEMLCRYSGEEGRSSRKLNS